MMFLGTIVFDKSSRKKKRSFEAHYSSGMSYMSESKKEKIREKKINEENIEFSPSIITHTL